MVEVDVHTRHDNAEERLKSVLSPMPITAQRGRL